MIKVCHFVNLITGKSDGVFNHLNSIFTTTDHAIFKHVLIFQGGEKVEKRLKQLNISYYKVNSLNRKFSLKTFYDFYRILKKEKPDILHTHLIKSYTIVGLLNILLKKKMIFNYHGLFINNPYNSGLQKIVYKLSNLLITKFNSVSLVITPSISSKNQLLSETNHFKKIRTYYNSCLPVIEISQSQYVIDELSLLKNKYFLVGIVARIEQQKRIDKALTILKELSERKQNVFFVFFGDGPLEDEMKNLSIKYDIDKQCKFYGYVENASLYLEYFDLLLLTSDWEGFPISVWEAMSKGIPILSSDVGGIKEVVESENCGIVYTKNDLHSATQIILDLIRKPKTLKTLGSNGKVAINNKYSLENFTKSIEKFYTELYEN